MMEPLGVGEVVEGNGVARDLSGTGYQRKPSLRAPHPDPHLPVGVPHCVSSQVPLIRDFDIEEAAYEGSYGG